MSTDAPLPSAELPSTSSTSASDLGSSWTQYGTGNNVGAELTTGLRQRRVGEVSQNPNQTIEQKSLQTMETIENDISENDNIGDGVGGMNAQSTSSPTAYAFSGSALVSDGVGSNLKEKLSIPNSTTQNKADENNANNASSSNESNSNNNEDRQDESMYECNICLDTAKDAVVSMCGHLFCWPCLHQWLETRPNRMLCPVCKAAISKEKVIPLYGRNSAKQEDPRNKVPPRPAGQRTEPEPQTPFQGFGFLDGFHMSFGIGAFPFGYFASSFNIGEQRPGPANIGTPHYEDQQQLSKLFMYLAFLCIGWLLFA